MSIVKELFPGDDEMLNRIEEIKVQTIQKFRRGNKSNSSISFSKTAGPGEDTFRNFKGLKIENDNSSEKLSNEKVLSSTKNETKEKQQNDYLYDVNSLKKGKIFVFLTIRNEEKRSYTGQITSQAPRRS